MHPINTLVATLVLSALLACKMFKKEEPTPSALPPPEPPPTTTTAATASPEPSAEPTKDQPANPTVVTKKGDAGAKDSGTSDASAATDSGASASDAGGGKGAACASKCQGVMQTCLTPSVKDGGLPGFADPTKCKAAFDDCVKACK